MSDHLIIAHDHQPLFRVIHASWADPLDATFSRQANDNRWNTPAFPALYCCCSEQVAVAVAEDVFRYAGVDLSDLQPEYRPDIARVAWAGQVVDMISDGGIAVAGIPMTYPAKVDKSQTRARAEAWARSGLEGVVCRSASILKKGYLVWRGGHEAWSELALFVNNTTTNPRLISRSKLII